MTVRKVNATQEQVAASDTTIYTVPAACRWAEIEWANCTNEDASTPTTITVNLVSSGGSAAVTNRYATVVPMATSSSDPLDEIVGAHLDPGDFISVIAANANCLNLKLKIKEVY